MSFSDIQEVPNVPACNVTHKNIKCIYLALGPQSASGLMGKRVNFFSLDWGVASFRISKHASSLLSLLRMAWAGDRSDIFFLLMGFSFTQHRRISQITCCDDYDKKKKIIVVHYYSLLRCSL